MLPSCYQVARRCKDGNAGETHALFSITASLCFDVPVTFLFILMLQVVETRIVKEPYYMVLNFCILVTAVKIIWSFHLNDTEHALLCTKSEVYFDSLSKMDVLSILVI